MVAQAVSGLDIKKVNSKIVFLLDGTNYRLLVGFTEDLNDLAKIKEFVRNNKVEFVAGLFYDSRLGRHRTIFKVSDLYAELWDMMVRVDFGADAPPLVYDLLDLLDGEITIKEYYNRVFNYVVDYIKSYVSDEAKKLES